MAVAPAIPPGPGGRAKFPQEDYLRLLDASESGDPDAVQRASAALARAVESAAADIRDKYLAPPHTTDFGILFLPTEGLYAEVARTPELLDRLQQRYRVSVAGPTTLAAFLNSLQRPSSSTASSGARTRCPWNLTRTRNSGHHSQTRSYTT